MRGVDMSPHREIDARGSHARTRGFTLIELLLTLGISALIATLAYAGLGTAIDASTGMQSEVRRLADVQRALNIVEEDLAQAVPRAIVNGLGSDEPAFRGGRFQDVVLEFTRGGLGNPQNLPQNSPQNSLQNPPLTPARSELQRVRYVLADGRLWRQSWNALDRTSENRAPDSSLLLEGVASIDVTFLAPAEAGAPPADFYALTTSAALWTNDWSSARIGPDTVAPLPIAVDLKLRLDDFGELRRVVELP
ncbi:MAG: type II secretion system minor pseudopilin GspJ [Pseudomonadota bacterium]|nr:type II secretion system minor pseudopilin GspJ [Pseudomonadota bacterium]